MVRRLGDHASETVEGGVESFRGDGILCYLSHDVIPRKRESSYGGGGVAYQADSLASLVTIDCRVIYKTMQELFRKFSAFI